MTDYAGMDAAMKKLESRVPKHHSNNAPPATDSTIKDFETKYDVVLPDSFKHFLKTFSFHSLFAAVKLDSRGITNFYGLSDKPYDISSLECNYEIRVIENEIIPAKYIPFGDGGDSSFGSICCVTGDNYGKVFYSDNIQSDLELASNDFNSFIQNISTNTNL